MAAAVGLIAAIVLALSLRHTPPRHQRAAAAPAPGSSSAPSTMTSSAPDPHSSAPTTTGLRPLGSQTGRRGTGPYANGAPARLDVAIAAPLDPLPPPDAGWHPLSVVQGTGNGTYATFHITSPTTQVRFRSTAADFHIFVVDQVQGREATAGYADVDCVGPCGDVMELSVPAGDYHVEVDADGPWELSLEEYAAPR